MRLKYRDVRYSKQFGIIPKWHEQSLTLKQVLDTIWNRWSLQNSSRKAWWRFAR